MPRYYFNLANSERILDEEGLVLADPRAAHAAALAGARSILSDEVRHGRLPLDERIEVMDEQGQQVLTVPFETAVEIIGSRR
jgi:hypothetical protein